MSEFWENLWIVSLPTLAVWGFLLLVTYLWHLVWAPYELEKVDHAATRKALEEREAELRALRGNKPRRIDPASALVLRDLIKLRASELEIRGLHCEHAASSEAASLAERLSEVIQMAGVASFPTSEMWGGYDARKRGVFVCYEGDEAHAAFAAELARTLSACGIVAETWERDNFGYSTISFYIARNPGT